MAHSAPDDLPKEAPMPVDPKRDPDMPENPQPEDPETPPVSPEVPEPANTPEDPPYDPFDDGNFPV